MLVTRCFQGPNAGSHRRRGAAVVEMAVVAPVFFLLIVGIIEFGRILMVQEVVTNASREGARRAVMESATPQQVQDLVDGYLTNASISGASMTLSPSTLGNDVGGGQPVTVTVSIPYSSVTWFPSSWFGLDGATIEASTVMRAERVQ
jgi:Flp pilus assembly protein TadG